KRLATIRQSRTGWKEPPRVLKSVTSSHLTATPRAVWTGCTYLRNIVHFYSMRVTKFCTRGGRMTDRTRA
ncbi:hypothetical protein D6D13_00423, partial [Aureobasidium pullulans]